MKPRDRLKAIRAHLVDELERAHKRGDFPVPAPLGRIWTLLLPPPEPGRDHAAICSSFDSMPYTATLDPEQLKGTALIARGLPVLVLCSRGPAAGAALIQEVPGPLARLDVPRPLSASDPARSRLAAGEILAHALLAGHFTAPAPPGHVATLLGKVEAGGVFTAVHTLPFDMVPRLPTPIAEIRRLVERRPGAVLVALSDADYAACSVVDVGELREGRPHVLN